MAQQSGLVVCIESSFFQPAKAWFASTFGLNRMCELRIGSRPHRCFSSQATQALATGMQQFSGALTFSEIRHPARIAKITSEMSRIQAQPPRIMKQLKPSTSLGPLKIAYVIQNAANELSKDIGQAALIKPTIRFLREAGHAVELLKLNGTSVHWITDLQNVSNVRPAELGWSGRKAFRLLESGVRRFQRELNLPYLALFDSYRFYDACRQSLSRFSICHEYGGLFSIGASLACKRLNVPHILHIDADSFVENAVAGSPITGLRKVAAASAARLTYRSADRLICVSRAAKELLTDKWGVDPGKITVIPNGVDTQFFRPDCDPRPARARYGLGADPVVAFVGAFQPWHGLDILIDSFAGVRREAPGARLLLVGDGRIRASLEERISNLDLGNSVTITGLVPQKEIPDILAAADVAVAPYPKLPGEMWFSPLKLYEYMSCGKAIVASRSGQTAEVLRHGENGILVDPGNPADLCRSLASLLANPAERSRLGANARKSAERSHSWELYATRLEIVYSDILTDRRRQNPKRPLA
jgi:glycosyltransferase involved in cell wall biosynthesis